MANSQQSVDDRQLGTIGRDSTEVIPKVEVRLTSEPTLSTIGSGLTEAIAPFIAIGGSLGALLLSFGWSFAWHWFAAWNVPYASLGLGPDVLLEYGRIVVLHHWWQALLWLVAAIAGGYAIFRFTLGKSALILVGLFLFLIPWFASHHLGKRVADAEFQQIRQERFAGLPVVILAFLPEVDSALSESVRSSLVTGPDLCHRLLFKASDGLWLLRLRNGGLDFETAFIPNETVFHMRLRGTRGERC